MFEDIKSELLIHGFSVRDNGIISFEGKNLPISHCLALLKLKLKQLYSIVDKLWTEVCLLLSEDNIKRTEVPEGIDSVFIHSLQGLKRMLYLYPGLSSFSSKEDVISKSLCKDLNSFSYRLMSKIIEYKLGIEWIGHLIAKNLYFTSMIMCMRFYNKKENKKVVAKGVHGPYSNLDIPMQERVFSWSAIDEEVAGRSRDIKNQRRYRMGLEGYNDPWVNEGFKWRELRNEPYLWGREGESPYPKGSMRP